MATLAEQLGFSAADRVVIVKADDAGLSHATNQAIFEAFDLGLLQAASVMVPAGWFDEVRAYAARHPEADFGVHLTLTSEMQGARWRPLCSPREVPGLYDPHGFCWARPEQVWQHATPEEVERECRAQIETALAAGLDVTHLDAHMGVLHLDARLDEVYRHLATKYALPVRMLAPATLEAHGLECEGLAESRAALHAAGVCYPDHFVFLDKRAFADGQAAAVNDAWRRTFTELPPSVTELALHPARPTSAMAHLTRRTSTAFAAAARAVEYGLLTDPGTRALLDAQGAHLLGYRALRDLQRARALA